MSTSKILAAAEPRGDVEAVRQLAREANNLGAHAVALLGTLTPKGAQPREYGRLLKALAEADLPAFYIPGPEDAPFAEFLREAAHFEIVLPHIHGVHGTFAMSPHYVLFCGMGGTIDDNPHTERDEISSVRYPSWEAEYRLKFLRELKDYEKIFLFTTSPAHKGLREPGSSILAEMIKTYNPRAVIVSGREPRHVMIANSLVITLGSLAEGSYSLIDLRNHEVTCGTLRQSVDASNLGGFHG